MAAGKLEDFKAFLETGKAISTDDFSGYLKEATSFEKREAAEMFG